MKKTYALVDLDCANCAAKMERAIGKMDGVTHVSVSFMSQKMTVEGADGAFDAIMEQVVRICKKFEPDCKIIRK